MHRQLVPILILLCLAAGPLRAQQQTQPAGEPSAFDRAARSAQEHLEQSITELNQVREQAAAETIPLSRQLSELESHLVELRLEHQDVVRQIDTRTLDLTNLGNEIKGREQEGQYLNNLFGEYGRKFESRLHISELARYEDILDSAKFAMENESLSQQERFSAGIALLQQSIDRLHEAQNGAQFKGTAVDPEGNVLAGNFLMLGPSVLFRSEDGSVVGTAEQRLGSLEPAVIPFKELDNGYAAARLMAEGEGSFPLDPTLGNAHKIEATEETLAEHIAKGGPVMVPIFALAGAALLVVLLKWMGFMRVREPEPARLRALLAAIGRHDEAAVSRLAADISKPAYLRDSLIAMLWGAALGTLAGWITLQDFASGLAQHLPFGKGILVYAIVFSVAGLAVQAVLRFLLGHAPAGQMLADGVEYIHEPSELIEEIMYEKVLATRLRLERMLPFVAISASAAPLLGLLGTVTGIINTFKMITVFGSGDVKVLSGGISEALITTEYGLIVAIPSLLLHAFLSRRARSVVNGMEKTAMAFMNQLGKTSYLRHGASDELIPISTELIKRETRVQSAPSASGSAARPAEPTPRPSLTMATIQPVND